MSKTPPDPPGRDEALLAGLEAFLASRSESEAGPEEKGTSEWEVPMALPVEPGQDHPQELPVALPVTEAQAEAWTEAELALPAEAEKGEGGVVPVEEPAGSGATAKSITCVACGSIAAGEAVYCSDCGYYFSEEDLARQILTSGQDSSPGALLQGRYELLECVAERGIVRRYRALDRGDGTTVPVMIVRQPMQTEMPTRQEAESQTEFDQGEEILPSFDEPEDSFPKTEVIAGEPVWPGIGWERKLLRTLEHPALPEERDYFTDDEFEYLVLEVPTGRSLWDAWEDPEAEARVRFGYLIEVAEVLHRLHQGNAMLEGLRPDLVVVTEQGGVRITDISDLLPLPFPSDTPVRGGLYTAPELRSGHGVADARADLYSFGAMVYALHLGRELNEQTDFDEKGTPKLLSRFPDLHPGFTRLLLKTLCKPVEGRFPTDEASREDATGFVELIRVLEVLARTQDDVRLDIASWTSTGMVRSGNEDGFAVVHGVESRQDDLGEAALVLLCDGMGGYEAGEVAAALALQSLRKQLLEQKPFRVAGGASPFETDPLTQMSRPAGHASPATCLDTIKQAIKQALRETNRLIFQTSRAPGSKRRGMGCTAEVVYVQGRHVVVGHVGDSRTYHLRDGELIQLTRDQTLVHRLVELGTLTEEEAATHPRRNELQQAIGGQPDVEPGLYQGKLRPGDWVLVCSDGLTNHVSALELQQMLQTEATSAEMAARRLVNLALMEGATDNVTVVAIRAT